MAVKVKLTGSQHDEVALLLEDYAAGGDVKVGKSVLTIPDDNDAPDVLNALREGHAAHTGDVGARRALAIAIRKLAEEIGDTEESTEEAETAPETVAEPASHLRLVDDTGETETAPEAAGEHDIALPVQNSTEDTAEPVEVEQREEGALENAPSLPDEVEVPTQVAGVLQAIAEGTYGSAARGVLRGHPKQDRERGTRYVARLRHVLYVQGCEKAGNALQLMKS